MTKYTSTERRELSQEEIDWLHTGNGLGINSRRIPKYKLLELLDLRSENAKLKAQVEKLREDIVCAIELLEDDHFENWERAMRRLFTVLEETAP